MRHRFAKRKNDPQKRSHCRDPQEYIQQKLPRGKEAEVLDTAFQKRRNTLFLNILSKKGGLDDWQYNRCSAQAFCESGG